MESLVRSLLLLVYLVLPETSAGFHSLRYFHTSVTRPGFGQPWYLSVGYVDDQQFVRFDSDSASQRQEPRAAWMERIGREVPEYWERNTKIAKGNAETFRAGLEILRSYFNQSAGGVHTFQAMSGCEVSPKLDFRKGFQQHAYDGHDYITLDTETYTWTAAVPQAVNTKRKWEANRSYVEGQKAYLEDICVTWLKKYLEIGKETLQRTDPPSARVTRHSALDGEVTLRCRVQDFYPADISLVWLRDGEEQLQATELIETRPAGDGTYQKWAAINMILGQEGEYTCQVQHQGLSQPLTLHWESPSPPMGLIVGVIAAVLLVLTLVIAFVMWRKNLSGQARESPQGEGRNGGQYILPVDNDSDQGSDVSLIARA